MRLRVIAVVVSFCFDLDLVFNGLASINPILDCKESHYIKNAPLEKKKVVLLLTNSLLLFLPHCVAP